MDIRQLEVFVRVSELRSFSRAAAALSLTQSTVSEHVRALEDELGTRLLDRLSRETRPTRAGELLLGYARRLLALREEARQALEHFVGRVAGPLAVGASSIPGEYVLPALLGRFLERFPGVTIALHISDSRGTCEAVRQGRVDVGVVGIDPEDPGLDARPLTPDELVAVVPPGHPWFGRPHATLGELAEQPIIVRETGSGSRAALERALAAAGSGLHALRVVAEMGSTGAIKQAVKAGVGLSIVSRRAVDEECRYGLLGAVTIEALRVTRTFYVVTTTGGARSPLATAFLEFLETEQGRI